ncbi:MAG: ATP-binding cassette domain-containing protein [Gemmatimonadales bacterium]
MLTSPLSRATSSPETILRVRGLTRVFSRGLARRNGGSLALNGIDLDIRAGDVVGLIGPEAAGKTTLLQCIAGLLRRDTGAVEWFGHLFPGGGSVPGVAYVPAVPVYYPFLTVRDVVEYRCARESTSRNRSRAVEAAISEVGLSEKINLHVAALSSEDVGALSIAEALSFDPQAILVDTSPPNENQAYSTQVLDALSRHAGSGGSVLIASRQTHSVVRCVTRVVALDEGAIVRTFSTDGGDDHRLDPVFPLPAGNVRFVAERMH